MLIKRAIILSLSFLALPSCSVFEDILSGISGFVDDNDDGPLFAYATDQNPPSVLIAVITDADAGLVLQGISPSEEMSEIANIVLSSDGRFVGGNYNLLIGVDTDFGIFLINTQTDSVEVFETDNTINLDRQFSCRLPDLQVMADALARNYVDVAFPDLNIPPENVTGVIEVAEKDSGNALSFSGWNGLQSFVARYDLFADVEVVVTDPPIRLPYDIGPILRIEGILHYQRTTGGSWTVDGCPGVIAAVLPRPVPVRNLTLSTDGKLIPDGSELAHSIAAGAAMEVHPVTHLSGPINQ